MKLESIMIKRFRSIESCEVSNCGEFNVLIGKNNSGKSNILSAIDAFFSCIRGGNVVTLAPSIGRDIDFFLGKKESPIEIAVTFSMLLAERDALIREIVTETPQMKNAADGLDPSLRLFVTVDIAPPPNSFGFVSKVALGGTVKPGSIRPDPERIILSITKEAAKELYERMSKSSKLQRNAASLLSLVRNIDSDDWSRMRAEGKPEGGVPVPRPPPRYLIRRRFGIAEIGTEMEQKVLSLIGESASFEEFSNAMRSAAGRMNEDASAVEDEPLSTKVGTFAGDAAVVPSYVRNMLGRISQIKVLHLPERRKPIGKEEAEDLLSLKVRRGGPEVLRGIQEKVSSLLGVKIDAFQGGMPSPGVEMTAEMDVDNFLVEVNGSGIREALRLILDVEFVLPNIVLVEEPEIHLHPALEISMMRYLKRISLNRQVFISTHSTNFLDTAEIKNVYMVSKDRSTEVQALTQKEAEAQIPQELGIRLSSLFMFDRLTFVEGPHDEDVLREWASIMGINFSQNNVGFVHMGGVRNFTHYAAEATLSFLTKRRVKMWFLLDRDEKEDPEITKLREAVGSNATVKVLRKREVENYLICSRAVIEFIKLKEELSGSINAKELPEESDIRKAFNECAEELKEMTVEKRVAKVLCKPVFPSAKRIFGEQKEERITKKIDEELRLQIEQLEEARKKLETAYREQLECVNGAWEASKLAIVPGDVLLDKVCQKFGVRFRKEQGDGARLAALMKESEIDQEIKEIIREIGS
jgi:putative ATP-dependent endonuclease of OLD family